MNDTICAISTSLGIGAISIIRLSGKEAIKIANKLFKGDNLLKVKTHTIHYGYIKDKEELIDEVLVSIMKSPKTFTKEDVVEINCHGGIATTNKVLELLLLNGCRLAEPGEFTKRAFLNGRIDLMEAEAVMELINDKSEQARKLSMQQLQGSGSSLIKKLRQDLLGIISNIEVNIDYPEYHDIYEVILDDIRKNAINIQKQLNKIILEYRDGKIISEGLKVAIVGRPNVGKSSILNKLLNENRAIVTDIPGTTRDIIEESITLDGILLNIIDTAGIRETADVVEKIGVDKSIHTILEADLVLVVLNNNNSLEPEDYQLLDLTKNKTSIVVINKDDLPTNINCNDLKNRCFVFANTVDDDGLNQLKDKIKELYNFEKINQSDYNYITSARQIAKIKECLEIMDNLGKNISDNSMLDMLEIDLKEVWNILGELIGETYTEELLDELFSKFCVGK